MVTTTNWDPHKIPQKRENIQSVHVVAWSEPCVANSSWKGMMLVVISETGFDGIVFAEILLVDHEYLRKKKFKITKIQNLLTIIIYRHYSHADSPDATKLA
jgi:hypothetical protein